MSPAGSGRPSTNRQGRHPPLPSDTVNGSPGRRRNTRSRWWRSSGSSSGEVRSATNTWGPSLAEGSAASGATVKAVALPEGGTDPGEEPAVGRGHFFTAELGQPTKELVLLVAECRRGVDHDLHQQVAA